MAESGYPDYGVSVWYGVCRVVETCLTISRKKSTPASTRRWPTMRSAPRSTRSASRRCGRSSQAEIDQFIATDRARWAGVIKALNISLD